MEMAEASDPYALFEAWFEDAKASEPADPNAMALATATPAGAASVRTVLMKGFDRRGVVFYTNTGSRKAAELAANPQAALCFFWRSLRRQVRLEGRVEAVTPAEADAYFASRARDSRIGAWASEQSRPLDSRRTLEARVSEFEARFPGEEVPRPPFWSGFRLVPSVFEFWHERPFRLHDRIVFKAGEAGWTRSRLYP